jgi:hypothetical protein
VSPTSTTQPLKSASLESSEVSEFLESAEEGTYIMAKVVKKFEVKMPEQPKMSVKELPV